MIKQRKMLTSSTVVLGALLTTQWWSLVISISPPVSSEEKTFVSSDKNSKFKILADNYYSDESYSSLEYRDDLDVPNNYFKKVKEKKQVLENNVGGNVDWDVLIFTQQWPVTTCYHWREEDKNHQCILPKQKEFWTVHGVWPTKFGHIGPSFCNKTWDFDIDQLNQIMEPLKQFWPDIDGSEQEYDWLWKHEWLKHGTCAASLEELNNELKYFNQGLKWRNSYLISNILGASNIHPDSNNTVVAIQTALYKILGKNPSIHCIYDKKKDISLLAEIRICFNKSLEVTDCDGVKLGDTVTIDYPGGTMITNCHVSKPIHYPSLVPTLKQKQKDTWRFPIVNIYKLVQFIMWFTL